MRWWAMQTGGVRLEVLDISSLAEESIAALDSADRESKHSFAIYILLRQRNA